MTITLEKPAQAGGNHVESDQLRLLIERVERLESDKAEIAADIKDVYGEAKANGYDTTTMRSVIRFRKMDKDKRDHTLAMFDTYMSALGLL